MSGVRLTRTQIYALRRLERRDWPAGEPRMAWFGVATLGVLLRKGMVEVRDLTDVRGILDLTPAGRSALNSSKGE